MTTEADWLFDIIKAWGAKHADFIKDDYEIGVPDRECRILADAIRAKVAEREAAGVPVPAGEEIDALSATLPAMRKPPAPRFTPAAKPKRGARKAK